MTLNLYCKSCLPDCGIRTSSDGGATVWAVVSEGTLIRVVGVAVALLLLVVVIVGLDFEAKMQVVMLAVLVLSILVIFVGSFLPATLHGKDRGKRGFEGYSLDLFRSNFRPDFR
jgi:solute carrier family 12 sodium/potassium/chloride transporter 2